MERIHELLQLEFPYAIIAPLGGGGTNSLFLIKEFEKRSIVKVAMISNTNARKEEACLLSLSDLKHIPNLYKSFIIDERVALHMEYIVGESFLDAILVRYKAHKYKDICPIFTSLGDLLGQLHNSPTSEINVLPDIMIQRPNHKTFIEDHLYCYSLELISNLSQTNDKDIVLVHGDYGYHNVLMSDRGSHAVVDWEMAGYGDFRVDISNVLFWTHLHFSDIAMDCVESFIEAYSAQRNITWSSEGIHAFVIFQVFRIIELVKDDFPEHVKKEWNRRLAWALNHKFM